jgi:hypothetical protein
VAASPSHFGFIRWNNSLTLRDPAYLLPRLDLARPAESGVFEVRSLGEEQYRGRGCTVSVLCSHLNRLPLSEQRL